MAKTSSNNQTHHPMKSFGRNLPVRHKIFFWLAMIISAATLAEGFYVNRTVKKALEQQMKLLDTFLNTIPCPVFLKDRNGVYMGCNNAFADQILGLESNRVVGKSLFEFKEKIPMERASHLWTGRTKPCTPPRMGAETGPPTKMRLGDLTRQLFLDFSLRCQ